MATKLDIMRNRDGKENWDIVDGKVSPIKRPEPPKVIQDKVPEEIVIKEEVKEEDEKPKKKKKGKKK